MSERKITVAGNPLTLKGKAIKVGDKAPHFTALNNKLEHINTKDIHGKIIVVTPFTSIDTGVCSAQLHHFNKDATNLGDDVVVISISCDLPFALERFCGAEGINNVITLSDHKDLDFASKYGYLIKELRLLSRGVIVIDKQSIVQYIEYVSENTNEPNYQEAIKAIKKIH